MLYEKSSRPPPADSLREALFLTLWLRRQEIEVLRTKVMITALNDVMAGKDNEATVAAFRDFYEAAFPFSKKSRGASDKKMVEVMKKEAAKGPIFFTPLLEKTPLASRAEKMRLPDEFRKKLAARSRSFSKRFVDVS